MSPNYENLKRLSDYIETMSFLDALCFRFGYNPKTQERKEFLQRKFVLRCFSDKYQFIFANSWRKVQENYEEGLRNRIIYLIKRKNTPANWRFKKEYSTLLNIY